MEKDILRSQLFDKYFEVEDGVLARDLVSKLSFIPEVWRKLHSLCEKNIKYFNFFNSLDKIRMIEHCDRRYLILELNVWSYVIIDIEKEENINDNELRDLFDVHIRKYDGDIQEFINFYIENRELLSLSSHLYYKLEIGDAWTYFCIDFVNRRAQMGFQTVDQTLYEQLHLDYELKHSGMQDATRKIGEERIMEMFEQIKDIKIPKEVIPEDLYQLYLERCERENKNCKCLKKDI